MKMSFLAPFPSTEQESLSEILIFRCREGKYRAERINGVQPVIASLAKISVQK